MHRAELVGPAGVRWTPQVHSGVGALETFLTRIDALTAECDRIALVGTSFGAEASLLVGSLSSKVDAVVAFAPSDVVWAGVDPAGRQTSHWTLDSAPVPCVPFDEAWEPDSDPPAFRGLYVQSRETHAADVGAATIPVERIPDVLLVAGGDDQVWPAVPHAESIAARRSAHRLGTTVVTLEAAGHRTVLPGEPVVAGGQRMLRGGTEDADRRLGEKAWAPLRRALSPSD